LGINNRKLEGRLGQNGGYCTGMSAVTGGSDLVANQWYHVAASYDNKTFRVFLNGVLVGSASGSCNTALAASSALFIGSSSGPGYYFNGLIDEVRYSNTARYTNNFIPQTTPFARDANTVGLWHFDEGTGLSVADSSGNANTGDLTGHAPAWVTNGGKVSSINQTDFKSIAPIAASGSDTDYYLYYGNLNEKGSPLSYTATGLKFDGSNDSISVNNSPSLTLTTNLTISAWIRKTSNGSYPEIYNSGNQGNSWILSISTLGSGNKLNFTEIGIADNFGATTLANNVWYHVVAVKNGDSGTNLTLYVNGVSDGTASIGTISTPSGTIHIGSWNNGIENNFPGTMDDVRIYSRALSAPEVTGLYTNSPYVSNSGLVGWWKLNDGGAAAPTTATDSSGNGNNGTLTNFNFDQNSNWVVNNSLLHATTEPTVSMMSSVIEQESPMFYQYRGSTGGPTPTYDAWSTRAPISATLQQLGATGVYVKFNPSGAYSTQDTYRIASWAVEAFSTSAPARGKLRGAPGKMNLVANNGGLDIIDASTNKLWMRLPKAANNLIGANNTLKAKALNGRIYIASADGLTEIRLDEDSAVRYTSTGNGSYLSNLANRSNASGYAAMTGAALNSTTVNAVSPTVVGTSPPKQYVAVATLSDLSVLSNVTGISPNNTTPADSPIYDYAATASDAYTRTYLTSGGTLYGGNTTNAGLNRYDSVQSDSADQVGSTDRTYNTASTPAIRSNAINDISVTLGNSLADYTSNQVALATDLGVEVIHEHSTMASGYVEHYTSTGNVGTSKYSSKNFGGALSFDGSNDAANIASSTSLESVNTQVTLEAWIKPDTGSLTATRAIMVRSTGANVWQYYINSSAKLFLWANNIGGFTSTGSVSENVWSHVVVSYDGGFVRFFINGVLDSSVPASGSFQTTSGSNVAIGANSSLASWHFKGLIDEARISNTARYSSNFIPSSTSFTRDANTVGLWHMDERYGGAAGINGQYVYDDSGNNNNGTLGAAATAGADDPLRVSPSISGADKVTAVGFNKSADAGRGLSFDGSTYAHSTNFSPPESGQTYTAWIKTSSASGGIGGFSNSSPASSTFDRGLYLSGGYLIFCITNAAGSIASIPTSTSIVNDNNWHFVVGVATGSTTYVSIDGGSPQGNTGSSYTGYTNYTTARYNIGNTSASRGGYFTGSIDDLRIYNRALSGSEIAALFNGGLGTTTVSSSGNVGWWKMNEGSGNTLTDSASTPHNADMTGHAATWSTGSPVKEQSALWVGTNGAGADDGAVTAISLATQRQITAYTTANSSLPDNDVTSLSLGTGGLALVGTENGAWPAGMAGIPVDDTAATPAAGQPTSDRLKSGTIRFKSGTIRLK
jgi:hypothetical protein